MASLSSLSGGWRMVKYHDKYSFFFLQKKIKIIYSLNALNLASSVGSSVVFATGHSFIR
jgi:hypothetical protein